MRGDDPNQIRRIKIGEFEFPACAGMIRTLRWSRRWRSRVPRMRGDDPPTAITPA